MGSLPLRLEPTFGAMVDRRAVDQKWRRSEGRVVVTVRSFGDFQILKKMKEEKGQKEEIGDGKDEERPKMEWKRVENVGEKE